MYIISIINLDRKQKQAGLVANDFNPTNNAPKPTAMSDKNIKKMYIRSIRSKNVTQKLMSILKRILYCSLSMEATFLIAVG